jgi:hypothetical protein
MHDLHPMRSVCAAKRALQKYIDQSKMTVIELENRRCIGWVVLLL